MAKRTVGKSKLTLEVRQRLAEVAAEARQLVYGERGCPEWGTLFAEIETDAKEVGHEFIRLLMEQTSDRQAGMMPDSALTTEAGETAQHIGSESRDMETESGTLSWAEPKAYLPKSRKDFFPAGESARPGG
jgi:hypothetical protein